MMNDESINNRVVIRNSTTVGGENKNIIVRKEQCLFVVLRQRRIRWDQGIRLRISAVQLQNRYLVRVKAKSTSFSCCTWRKKDTNNNNMKEDMKLLVFMLLK